ncbi:MAG: pyridoxal phosphate-dependent aminotransferase family protein [Flavobacteriaceae bacterium]|nr:pyridoxal phosphate-dependent aminotransferase family protein [Flavobacteriaceae bacterium]
MSQLPNKLREKLKTRKSYNALRCLKDTTNLIDFSSNDYLGFSTSKVIFDKAAAILKEYRLENNGATGSRLLSGNHKLFNITEATIAAFHNVEDALIFTSGYDANIGFFSCIPQRGDIIFYDELCHASIRDGIQLSLAKSYKYKHDDVANFLALTERIQSHDGEIYVITESVFSMDGDTPDLMTMAKICEEKDYHLVVDEAHAIGVFGVNGIGKIQELGLEALVFARIVTFGKALGCHGAAILGSTELKQYLVNFARSFMYTTGLPPHSVATIWAAYTHLSRDEDARNSLNRNTGILRLYIKKHKLENKFIPSESAVYCCVIPGNDRVKSVSEKLMENGFDVKPILSPTVPFGKERLRLCIHSYNTEEEIKIFIELMATFVK